MGKTGIADSALLFMDENPYQSPQVEEPSRRRVPSSERGLFWDREPWYLRYPLSSLIAIVLAAAATIGFWITIVLLAAASGDGAVLGVLGLAAFLAFSVALWALMRVFYTGAISSVMISFVWWIHFAWVLCGVLMVIAGSMYEGPEHGIGIGMASLCLALSAAVLHGVILGVVRKRGF